MPKKPPKNGFFYFMLNYKRRAECRGRTFPGGLSEVAAAASPEWKILPQFRKDYFNEMAKERKNDPRPSIPKRDERRFNSQGVSFAEIKLEKAKAEERRKQECDFISKFVHQMNLNDLRNKLMYLIHVNIFCKTNKDVYYPAEIGMVKFSLKEGVKGVFHRYIDPGDIAPGYSFEVKDHSERTHRLTPHFVSSVDGTSDFSRLYREICEFLSEDELKSEGIMPPLFTMYDNVFLNSSLDAVKGTFRSLWAHEHPSHDQDDNSWESVFKVLPLPDMFFHLKNRCMAVTNPNTIAFPNDVLAKAQLQKDTYHYELSTACKFHRDEDVIAHCSQSFVLRWVYIIRDHCADLIGVDLFPKYVAPKTEIKDEVEDNHDTMSMTDSKYSSSCSEASREPTDWRVKHERDRYYSPERRVKRDRDLYYSPERGVKRERDRYYSPERVPKREKDRHCSPERVPKRERAADIYTRVSPVECERKADGFPGLSTSILNVEAYLVKPEKESCDVFYAGSFKRERVDEKVIADSMKEKQEPFISSLIKHEKEASWYSLPASIELEKDVASSIKQEKNADFIKQEANGTSMKQEKVVDSIKEEKGTSTVKEEKGAVKEEKVIPVKENDIKVEKKIDVDPATGRYKVEKIDPDYGDW